MKTAMKHSALLGLILLWASTAACGALEIAYTGEIFVKDARWLPDNPTLLYVEFNGQLEENLRYSEEVRVNAFSIRRSKQMPDADWAGLIAQFQSAKGKTVRIKIVPDSIVKILDTCMGFSSTSVVSLEVK